MFRASLPILLAPWLGNIGGYGFEMGGITAVAFAVCIGALVVVDRTIVGASCGTTSAAVAAVALTWTSM